MSSHKPLEDLNLVFSGDHDLRPYERAVLAVLVLRRDNGSGACFPGQPRIAADVGVVPRNVRRILGRLEGRGIIEREVPPGRSTQYTLHLKRLADSSRTSTSTPDTDVHPGHRRPPRTQTSRDPGHLRPGTPDTGVRRTAVLSAELSASPPEGAVETAPDHMTAQEVVAEWIKALGSRPEGVEKQGAVAKRLAKKYPRATILQAIEGIQQLFPHSEGTPWDLFVLEKKFTMATTDRTNGKSPKRKRSGYSDPAAEMDYTKLARDLGQET